MLKEAGELAKAVLDFLRSPRLGATLFLCSGAWLVPAIRPLFPIHGGVADTVSLAASLLFALSGASLAVSAVIWLFHFITGKKRLQARRLRKALRRATPMEKAVLQEVIRLGKWEIRLDAGSAIAMHMQEIGVIGQAMGSQTTYQIADGLRELCIGKPSLLHLPENEEESVVAELKEWQKTGQHRGFFYQLSGPGPNAWMG